MLWQMKGEINPAIVAFADLNWAHLILTHLDFSSEC